MCKAKKWKNKKYLFPLGTLLILNFTNKLMALQSEDQHPQKDDLHHYILKNVWNDLLIMFILFLNIATPTILWQNWKIKVCQVVVEIMLARSRKKLYWGKAIFPVDWSSFLTESLVTFSISIIEIFKHKEVTSNDAINLSSSMGTFLMYLENVVEFLVWVFSS